MQRIKEESMSLEASLRNSNTEKEDTEIRLCDKAPEKESVGSGRQSLEPFEHM